MKRSEMLKVISDELYDLYPSDFSKYTDIDADRILRRMEDAGMPPPKVNNSVIDDSYFDLYEWEPEDNEDD